MKRATSGPIDPRIIAAANEISAAIGKSFLDLPPLITAKHRLTGGEFATAFAAASIQLVAGAAAGLQLGADASDTEREELCGRLIVAIQWAIDREIKRNGNEAEATAQ